MDLFVINRHDDTHTEVSKEEEQTKLDKLLQKIERNRKNRNKRKDKERVKQEIINKTRIERQKKRERKAEYVNVPENKIDEFIDTNVGTEIKQEDVEQSSQEATSKKKSKKVIEDSSHNIEGFTVLGSGKFNKKSQVKAILPKWLTFPTVVSVNLQNLQTKVSSLKDLDKTIRKQLKSNGIKYFFPVQAQVIPWLLKANSVANIMFPRDICVSAPTGSGKTLAFVLPVIQALKRHTVRKIRALVILPTQDLAMQVFKAFKDYSVGTNIEIGITTGNNSFQMEQKMLLSKNVTFGLLSRVDVLVCTAGRLVDHLKLTEGFNLRDLEFLIIDEADKVIENVQNDWLYHLEKHIYRDDTSNKILNLCTLKKKRPPQKLLFSATLSQDPEKLQKLSLFQPKLFTSVVEQDDQQQQNSENVESTYTFIGKYTTPKELTEKYIVCSVDIKPLVLYKFIKTEKLTKTLIFTNSLNNTHRLSILLKSLFKDELKIQEINSHLQVKNRKKLIEDFSSGQIDILVCTDALARGIDLPGIQCVISYSAPKFLKTYIHRAGRTARAGEFGLAVTLLHNSQVSHFKSLLQHAEKNNVEEVHISEDNLETLGKQYKTALENLKNIVHKEEKEDISKMKRSKQMSSSKGKRKRVNSTGST